MPAEKYEMRLTGPDIQAVKTVSRAVFIRMLESIFVDTVHAPESMNNRNNAANRHNPDPDRPLSDPEERLIKTIIMLGDPGLWLSYEVLARQLYASELQSSRCSPHLAKAWIAAMVRNLTKRSSPVGKVVDVKGVRGFRLFQEHPYVLTCDDKVRMAG